MPRSIRTAVLFCLLLAGMFFITLYPFNFYPDNGCFWLPKESGLYFNGHGIAYSDSFFPNDDRKPAPAITVELLLKKRMDSINSGSREIFSLYDGQASPPFLVGEWGQQFFVYSRYEQDSSEKWTNYFRPKWWFARGKTHFIAFTFGPEEKALYLNGMLIEKILTHNTGEFSGRILLGNSPHAAHGWMGEIKGVAVYDRVLDNDEIFYHNKIIVKEGMRALAGTTGLRSLYPLDEGSGSRAANMLGSSQDIVLPKKCIAFKDVFFYRSEKNMRTGATVQLIDILLNVFLFVPLGFLLADTFLQTKKTRARHIVFMSMCICAVISLSIEGMQLAIPDRFSSFSDVLFNTAGAGFGALAAFVKGANFGGLKQNK